MTDLSVDKLKSIFRQNLKSQREKVPTEEAQAAAESLWNQLKEQTFFHNAKRVAAFCSFKAEISTMKVLEGILASGKELYLPRVEKGQTLIQFYPVTDLKKLAPGQYEILEPPAVGVALAPSKIDLILVPGLGFDNRGHRLGYGQGHYDRFLKVIDPHCFTLGISYAFQLIDKVPNADHDSPVNAVLTEKFIMLC